MKSHFWPPAHFFSKNIFVSFFFSDAKDTPNFLLAEMLSRTMFVSLVRKKITLYKYNKSPHVPLLESLLCNFEKKYRSERKNRKNLKPSSGPQKHPTKISSAYDEPFALTSLNPYFSGFSRKFFSLISTSIGRVREFFN